LPKQVDVLILVVMSAALCADDPALSLTQPKRYICTL
jgi:hypothetical protein